MEKDLRRIRARRRRDLAMVANVGAAIGSYRDRDGIVHRLVVGLRQHFRCDLAEFALIDSERGRIDAIVRDGDFPVLAAGASGPGDLSGTLADACIRKRGPVVESVEDIGDTLARIPKLEWAVRHGFRSILAAPVETEGRVVGIIHAMSRAPHSYDQDDVLAVSCLASLVGVALSNARLHADSDEQVEERAVFAELCRLATSSLDLDAAFPDCARTLLRLLRFDGLSIAFLDAEGFLETAFGYTSARSDPIPPGRRSQRQGSVASEALASDRVIVVDATDGSTKTRYPALKPLLEKGLRSFMVAPLHSGGRARGVVSVWSQAVRAYTRRDAELLQRAADHMAGPAMNSILLKRLEEEHREAQLLADIGRLASSSLDANVVFQACGDQIRQHIPVDALVIVSVNREQSRRKIEYSEGIDFSVLRPFLDQPLTGTLTERALATRRAVLESVDTIDGSIARYPGATASLAAGFRSLLCAPLIVADGAVGAIHVRSRATEAYGSRELRLFEKIAAQIAPAILNLRLHESKLKDAENRALLASQRAEVARLANERDELQKLTDARKKLLTLVSHELKTPLAATKAYLELLLSAPSGNFTERQLRQLRSALGSSQHLELIVNDLLDLSRLDAGAFRLEIREFDLRNMLEETRRQIQPIFDDREQVLDLELELANGAMRGDEDRIRQALINVLSNASKFSPARSTVSMVVERRRDLVVIEVVDRGIGISPVDMEKLFAPFFRADNAAIRRVPGTGMGLYITKSIVQLHGGTIRVESEPEKGSTFTVELPAGGPPRGASNLP